MFVVPTNPNAVHIPMRQTGCCKSEFDSTYPIQLNGIISQTEFQESMENINRNISSRMSLVFFGVIFFLCIFGGMALFIAGGITTVTSRTFGFPTLVGVGFGVFFLGMIILVFGCCAVQLRRTVKIQKAVAEESRKYSSRSFTPCSWRLHSTRFYSGGYGNRRTTIAYRIIIEIGHSGASANGYAPYQGAYQSTSFFSPQNNVPSAPPYDGNSATRFCNQCGAPRQNPTAHFCASCGQPFDMF